MHVLVVEDSPTMRGLIAFALRRYLPEVEIQEAENGQVALDVLAERAFDVILVDINMPIMGGFALLERLRDRADVPPVIVITTEGAAEDVERATSLGASAYVTKPIKAPELGATLKRVLRS